MPELFEEKVNKHQKTKDRKKQTYIKYYVHTAKVVIIF